MLFFFLAGMDGFLEIRCDVVDGSFDKILYLVDVCASFRFLFHS